MMTHISTASIGARLRLPTFVRELYAQSREDRVGDLATLVAYRVLFAIPALLLLLASLTILVDRASGANIADELRTAIARHAPGESRPLLDSLVQRGFDQANGMKASTSALITLVIAFWGGAGGIGALVFAFNRAYDVEDRRSTVRRILQNLWLTVVTGGLILVAFTLFVGGQRIGQWIANWAGLGEAFTRAWDIARWPAAIFSILFVLAVLYYVGPDVEQEWRWISPGSILATAGWVLAALGFRIYLSLADPGSAFGAAGGVIVLLFFLYVTALVFIVGAEINAIVARRHDPTAIADMASDPSRITDPETRTEVVEEAASISA